MFIQIYKQETGIEYTKIIQNVGNDLKKSILINPHNLDEIIKTLINFKEEIAINQKIIDPYLIKKSDEKNIINTFLKGIIIKDLGLVFQYNEGAIKDLLIKNEIVIIDGIGAKSTTVDKRKFLKKKK